MILVEATVLDIKDVNKGSKLARATIEYEPGPDVNISSVYNVFFYADMTTGEVQKSTTSVLSRNT